MAGLLSVIVIRHAISRANQDPTEYARTPDHAIPLVAPDDDVEGLLAAETIASLGLDPATVVSWSSPHLRCRQTERLVLRRAFGERAAHVDCRESFLLRERDYGEWNGLPDEEVKSRFPELHAKWVSQGDPLARFLFRYPGGESRADVALRAALFQERLRRDAAPHHLLFVHGIVHRLLRMAWFDRSPSWVDAEPHPANASIVRIARPDTASPWVETKPGPQGRFP